MTRDHVVSIVGYHLPGLQPGEVAVLEGVGRILIAVRRPEAELVGLRSSLYEFPMGISVEVRSVTDGGPLLPVSP